MYYAYRRKTSPWNCQKIKTRKEGGEKSFKKKKTGRKEEETEKAWENMVT